MNQPEFWITVKEGGVYPTRVTSGSSQDFLTLSEEIADSSRTTRFYCRKLIDVQFTDSPGKQTLTYDTTDIYEHAYMLDIRDQPPEGSILVCIWINSKLFAFANDTRHDGGTP